MISNYLCFKRGDVTATTSEHRRLLDLNQICADLNQYAYFISRCKLDIINYCYSLRTNEILIKIEYSLSACAASRLEQQTFSSSNDTLNLTQ